MCGARVTIVEDGQQPQHKVIKGLYGNICDECVSICADILLEAQTSGKVGTIVQGNIWIQIEVGHRLSDAIQALQAAKTRAEHIAANNKATAARKAWQNAQPQIIKIEERHAS